MGRLGQTLSGVAAPARRRPVRSAALSVGAAGVAAVIAIPLAIGGTGTPSAARNVPYETVHAPNEYPHPVPWPWSGLTMNGRPPNDANGKAAEPWFDVVAGEKVTFVVTVTVPAHAEMTKLFLGITTGGDGGSGPHGPIGMVPVLATASHLTAGPHRFTLRWTVPRGGRGALLGYEVAGAAYWPRGTKGEPGDEEGPMANVFVEQAGN